jgi:hypothetical protein
MAKADHDDTSSPYEWVSPREYVKRIARDPAAETEAEYSVAEQFRRGEIRYRYRGGDGTLHYDDLFDDFRCEAVIELATATATRPGRTIRADNPDLPLVGDPLRPRTPQWFGDDPQSRGWDPFSRPHHIDRVLPAEMITELQFLAPPAPAIELAAPKEPAPTDAQPHQPRSRKRREPGTGNTQRRRARVILRRLYGKEYPTEEEVADADLLVRFAEEYERVEGKANPPSKYGKPSDSTVLREVGRKVD